MRHILPAMPLPGYDARARKRFRAQPCARL